MSRQLMHRKLDQIKTTTKNVPDGTEKLSKRLAEEFSVVDCGVWVSYQCKTEICLETVHSD